MVVLGTRHHVVMLCQPSRWKLHPGQELMDSNRRLAMPMGVYAYCMGGGCMPVGLHFAWLQVFDSMSFWCSKCGDGGGLEDNNLLLVCHSKGCGQAHQLSCSGLEPIQTDFW